MARGTKRVPPDAAAPHVSAFRELATRHDVGDIGGYSAPEWYSRFAEHAQAKLVKFQQITPADRFKGFARLGFRPHGLYLPDDDAAKAALWQRVWKEIGAIPEDRIDDRLAAYYALQDETAKLEAEGIPGAWGGQQAVARSAARFRVVGCARRWGKTALAAHEALSCALQRPRSKVWLCAPIMRLVDRAFKIVAAYIEDYHLPVASVQNTAAIKRIVFENGAIIDGVSMENVLSMAGDEVDVAIIDEAAQMYPDAWSRGVLPPLLDRNGQALLISSWEGMEGIFFQLFEEGKRRDDGVWECFSGRSADNFFVAPQGEDTPALVEAKRSTDPLDYHEQYGGVAAHQRLIIYPELNLRVHVEKLPFDPGHPVILAGDPSGGAVEYAVLAIQDYPVLRRIHIIDEVYMPTGYTEQVIREVDHRFWRDNVSDVVLDSASPAEIERWGRAGFNAYGVYEKLRPEDSYPMIRRALRDPVLYYSVHQELLAHIMHGKGYALEEFEGLPAIEQRVLLVDLEEYLNDPHLPQAVIDRLKGCAQLRIADICVNTILEHQNLHRVRPRATSSAPKEAARKWKDHTCASANTRVATARGQVPLGTLRPGDEVWTLEGWRPVVALADMGERPVVEVETADGHRVVLTSDHPVWVEGTGEVSVGDLRQGMRLVTMKPWKYRGALAKRRLKSWYSKANDSTVLRLPPTSAHPPVPPEEVSKPCTSRSGRPPMAPFRQGTISTTVTTTLLTMPWITWSVSRRANTIGTTATNWQHALSGALSRIAIWLRSALLPRRGIVLLAGASGTRSMDGVRGISVSPSRGSVPSVVESTRPATASSPRDSAPTNARPPRGVQAGWMTWTSAARSAEPRSERTDISECSVVHSVRTAGVERVYDLEVEDTHRFFGNGLYLGQCDSLRYFMIQFHRWDGDEQASRVRMLMDDDDQPIGLQPLRAGERETDPHDVPLKYTPDGGWLTWARETYTPHGRSRMIDLLEDR